MSSKAMQKATVGQFMSITGVNEKMALKLLKASNWKVDQAADRQIETTTSIIMAYIHSTAKARADAGAFSPPPPIEFNRTITSQTCSSNWGISPNYKRWTFYENVYGLGGVDLEGEKEGYGASKYDFTWRWLESQDPQSQSKPVSADGQAFTKTGRLPAARGEKTSALVETQSQAPPLRQGRHHNVLSGHERKLLAVFSSTSLPANILEVMSMDRQPLPPTLARALAHRDLCYKPSVQSPHRFSPNGKISPSPPIRFQRHPNSARQPSIDIPKTSLVAGVLISNGSRELLTHVTDLSIQQFSWYSNEVLVDARYPWKTPTLLSPALSNTFAERLTNVTSNSYFASNGASSAGSKDTDALGKLFEKYRVSTDDENMTSVEGTMQYLQDLGVNLESAELFLACEIVQAPGLGELSGESFIDGWKSIGADTIVKQKAYISGQVKQLPTDTTLFKRVYKHTFVCAKEKGSKALPLENALVYWGMLFAPPGMELITKSCNWSVLWQDYLKANWTKSVNRDMWNQTLEFFLKVMQDEDLTFWSEDGAWPGVIDDFVAYAKVKRGIAADTMETD